MKIINIKHNSVGNFTFTTGNPVDPDTYELQIHSNGLKLDDGYTVEKPDGTEYNVSSGDLLDGEIDQAFDDAIWANDDFCRNYQYESPANTGFQNQAKADRAATAPSGLNPVTCSPLKDHQIASLVNALNNGLGADLVRAWNDMCISSETRPIYSRSDARKSISAIVKQWVNCDLVIPE